MNGEMSADLSFKSKSSPWNHEHYIKEVAKKDALMQSYLDHCQQESIIQDKLNDVKISVGTLEDTLERSTQQRETLQSEINESQSKIIDMQNQIAEYEIQASKLKQSTDSSSLEIDSKVKQIEESVYKPFLERLKMDNIRQFENVYFQNIEDDLMLLNQYESHFESLKNKLNQEKSKNIQESLEKWQQEVNEQNVKFQLVKCELLDFQKQYETDCDAYETFKASTEEICKQVADLQFQLKSVLKELSNAFSTHEAVSRTFLKTKARLNKMYVQRHELYKQAYVNLLDLPFEDGWSVYDQLFRDSSDLSDQEIYQMEDEIRVDFQKHNIDTLVKSNCSGDVLC